MTNENYLFSFSGDVENPRDHIHGVPISAQCGIPCVDSIAVEIRRCNNDTAGTTTITRSD